MTNRSLEPTTENTKVPHVLQLEQREVTMMETPSNNGNVTNPTRGLNLFSGKDPTLFETWYEKTSLMLSISRPGIHNVM